MKRITVYVCGYVKSGTTHLTRLLGDVMNCRTGGSLKSQDSKEPAAGGFDRPGPFEIRKGHFKIIDDYQTKAVKTAHIMNPDMLKSNQFVICLFRDPRDIAVSMSFYWKISVQTAVDQMITGTGHSRFCGNWGEYVTGWLQQVRKNRQVSWIRFEDLIESPETVLQKLSSIVGNFVKMSAIERAIERNQIDRVKERIKESGHLMPLGQEVNTRLVRNGTPGEWKKHIGPKLNRRVYSSFDGVMRLLDYGFEVDYKDE